VTQLALPLPVPAPAEPQRPASSEACFWREFSLYMGGELETFPRNVATDVRLVAEAHRARVNGAAGRRG
jgi:hypothetical protein